MLGHGASIVRNGLVLHLDAANTKSYPGSGTTWYDLSGTNHGTLTNGPSVNNSYGGSVSFDGVDDHVAFASNPSLTNQITAEVWVRLVDSQGPNSSGLIVGKEGSFRMLYSANAVDWVCATANNGWYTTGTAVTAGSLSVFNNTLHIVATYDGANNRVYVNGVLKNTGSAISGNILTSGTFYLMKTTAFNVDYGQGTLFVHRLYNRALSLAEIKQNFEALRGRYGI